MTNTRVQFLCFYYKTIDRSDKRYIEGAEIRFLRPMALWDKKRGSDIRKQLGIFSINDKLTQYKTNWRNIYKEWMTTDFPKK